MDAFKKTVEGRHDYYHVIGNAAAALMGLLFISLSLNVREIPRKANADLRVLAGQTFSSFLWKEGKYDCIRYEKKWKTENE
jgi:hypothetical protein